MGYESSDSSCQEQVDRKVWKVKRNGFTFCFQWQLGGGRSHDRVTFEFRATRWNVVVPSHSSLQDLGAALWDLQQQLNPAYTEESTNVAATAEHKTVLPRRMLALPPSFPEELNILQKLLPFPEEVALKLSEVEYELFNNTMPVDYLRHCTTDLTSRSGQNYYESRSENGVPSLIRRFNEVSCIFSSNFFFIDSVLKEYHAKCCHPLTFNCLRFYRCCALQCGTLYRLLLQEGIV